MQENISLDVLTKKRILTYFSIFTIFFARIAFTRSIKIPSPINAYATGKSDKIHFPSVVYNAKTPKITDLVVAIATPFVWPTSTWFHDGIHSPSKKLKQTITMVIKIQDLVKHQTRISKIACAIVEKTRTRVYPHFSPPLYAQVVARIIAISDAIPKIPASHGSIQPSTRSGNDTRNKKAT